MKFIYLSLVFGLSLSYGAKHKALDNLKNTLAVANTDLTKVKGEIVFFEKEIGTKNDLYISKVKLINSIDQKLEDLQLSVVSTQSQLKEKRIELKSTLDMALLEKVDSQSVESLIRTKILNKKVKVQGQELKKMMSESERYLSIIQTYKNKISKLKSDEKFIHNLILDLELKKRKLSQKYITYLDKKSSLTRKISLEEVKTRLIKTPEKKSSLSRIRKLVISKKIQSPVRNFEKYKKSSKGITYQVNRSVPLTAPGKGRVIYSGDLASYGKVIIIDHGDDIRSVMLGDFIPKVKKNEVLAKGKLIGYSLSAPGVARKIYYELREKDKAKNTAKLLKKI